jgi:hypothetical protein
MLRNVLNIIVRPLLALWIRLSPDSWTGAAHPEGPETVHSRGSDPDRILVVGSGIAAGYGALTHELALAGHLARRLSVLTTRAVDIESMVSVDMTAAQGQEVLGTLDLSRFDGIVVSFGVMEALGLRSARSWERDVSALLETLTRQAPDPVQVFMLAIPRHGYESTFPRLFAALTGHMVLRFNDITRIVCAALPRTTFIELDRSDSRTARGTYTYERWASMIAPWISSILRGSESPSERQQKSDEPGRLAELDRSGMLDSGEDDAFDLIASMASALFDVPMAAITFIDAERQWTKSAIGFVANDLPRSEAFCNVTIDDARHFVVEDAWRDPRFSDSPLATGRGGVRFYAGYPIESEDGHRLGALCVMDHEPRHFTLTDASLLRDLAMRVQELVWSSPSVRPPAGVPPRT